MRTWWIGCIAIWTGFLLCRVEVIQLSEKIPRLLRNFFVDITEKWGLPVRRIAESMYTVVHWSEFDRGGHFAAMEVPDQLAEDLRSFFRQFRD